MGPNSSRALYPFTDVSCWQDGPDALKDDDDDDEAPAAETGFLEEYSAKKRAYLQQLAIADAKKPIEYFPPVKPRPRRRPPPKAKSWRDFMKLVTDQALTSEELEMLHDRCFRSIVTTPSGHMMPAFKVRTRGLCAPPNLRFYLRGVPLSLYRRNMSLFLRLHKELGRVPEWPSDSEKKCFTICGQNKLCVAPTHLNLENYPGGKERSVCHNLKECRGHGDLPDCVISEPKPIQMPSTLPK